MRIYIIIIYTTHLRHIRYDKDFKTKKTYSIIDFSTGLRSVFFRILLGLLAAARKLAPDPRRGGVRVGCAQQANYSISAYKIRESGRGVGGAFEARKREMMEGRRKWEEVNFCAYPRPAFGRRSVRRLPGIGNNRCRRRQ